MTVFHLSEMVDWRVLLDISVLAVFFSILYHTLRTTGTWKIALGLTLAAVAAMVAGLLDLRGVEWVFSNLSQITFLALLIIFQPEIRRILERSTSIGRSGPNGREDVLASLIDEAVFDLARRKWGALIVIPGRYPLQQWVSGGVELHALPSLQLLLSLFDPDSPGHDGAIICDKGRVERFAVRLPLSQSGRLPEWLGTRHHAAMGLAEQSDALILAVSEERGRVSLFHNGEMTPLDRKGEAAARIARHLTPEEGGLPEKMKKQGWKIGLEIVASLLVAVFFWGTVIASRTESREMFFTVPIVFSKPAAGLTLVSDNTADARILLRGPVSLLMNLESSRLQVYVDLSGMEEGRQVVMLTKENVVAPKKVEILHMTPATLEIELSRENMAMLEITPQLIGKPAEGYVVEKVEVLPKNVRVFLPGEILRQNRQQLLTTPIYLHGLRENASVFCKIIVPQGVRLHDTLLPDVEVRVHLRRTGGTGENDLR